MPLNLSINDGDFTPYLKYNAKAGRFYVRVEGASDDVEVQNPRLIFDMENIKTGWLYYEQGSGPEKVWDPSRTQMAPKPAGPRKFKRGFEVMVYGNDPYPGVGIIGLREFSSTATNCIATILGMFNEYELGAPQNPGKVPFFGCTGVKAISGMYGTNYEPSFRLIAWIERHKVPALDEHRQSSGTNGKPQVGEGFTNNNDWQAPLPPAEPDFDRGDPIPF
jgi:hypothetical protein